VNIEGAIANAHYTVTLQSKAQLQRTVDVGIAVDDLNDVGLYVIQFGIGNYLIFIFFVLVQV
jgi:hypothetical protein